jgi:3-hydroxybutyryl-CoA dehydrogenase
LGTKLGDQKGLIVLHLINQILSIKGKWGEAVGEGFYKYPNPRYADADFLK